MLLPKVALIIEEVAIPALEDNDSLAALPPVRTLGREQPFEAEAPRREPVIEVEGLCRMFGSLTALDDVSFDVAAGQVHALIGPNGAGKTTLLRILVGLLAPTSGSVRVLGVDLTREPLALRSAIGLVPGGDRSFYLRISGIENLLFYARLRGLGRKDALKRACWALDEVGLAEAARQRVGLYSHGMQKRLAVARALLGNPRILLVDEATHDLDPDGARRVRELVARCASAGTAVVWTTQKLDEIRAFSDQVTLLQRGHIRFSGAVSDLLEYAVPRRFLIRLEAPPGWGWRRLEAEAQLALGSVGSLVAVGEHTSTTFRLSLGSDNAIGTAVTALERAGIRVSACTHEHSEMEEAFFTLTQRGST